MEASHTFRFDPKTPPSCQRFNPSDPLIGLLGPSEAPAKTLEPRRKNCASLTDRPTRPADAETVWPEPHAASLRGEKSWPGANARAAPPGD